MSCALKKVVIIQEKLPHYRSTFFNQLRDSLAESSISLEVVHGNVRDSRLVESDLDWVTGVPIRRFGPFLWHQLGNICANADLVIIPQEIKLLRCLALQLQTRFCGPRLALWGHGRNFQATASSSPAERFKRFISRHVDWWFAYNDLSAAVVSNLGFPEARITSVGNSIDTNNLVRLRQSTTGDELAALRAELHLDSENVAVYTGGLYATKRIDFLLKAALLIRERIPDFELIVIGSGPDHQLVADAANQTGWVHTVGPKNDREKVPYWALSKILLMPGGVGLAVLDSFALGVPMVTTDTRLHGPEIDYLKSGENGLLVPCGESHQTYANAVADLMIDEPRLTTLAEGALSSASLHSIESMTENFTRGILQVLEYDPSNPIRPGPHPPKK